MAAIKIIESKFAAAEGKEYPEKLPKVVPPGKVIVHNRVRPSRIQGVRGFRFWFETPSEDLTVCNCGWAPELGTHYR
jgi:hypothetical protein